MKYILFIFLMSFVVAPSYAQERLSRADSLILARIDTVGPWKGIYITNKGNLVFDENAPNWSINALIDSFSEKSADVKEVFAFIRANAWLLYQHYGNEDLYFFVITNKEVIEIKVKKGRPQINRTERRYNNSYGGSYWSHDSKYVKKIPN